MNGGSQSKFTYFRSTQHCSSLVAGKRFPPSAWIMPQHAWRDKTYSWLSKAAESLPNQIVCPHHTGKSAAQFNILSHRLIRRIEQAKIRILTGRLNKSASNARITKKPFQILGRKISRQINLTRTQPG